MFDRFKRNINYLRISVTDRCNLRCIYCMPADGIKLVPHEGILTFDEILNVVKVAVNKGIKKIKITGGEPLVRRGIVQLIEMIATIDGVTDFGMTTNATLLDKFAFRLKDAGLQRINVSLDTINPEKYTKITRGGDINKVFEGIKAARVAGLTPIKINCVIKNLPQEEDAKAVAKYCSNNGFEIRYIHEMNLEKGVFQIVEGGDGGNCENCNRLRLTAKGDIKPCLFSDFHFNIRELGIEEAINMALHNKPLDGKVSYGNKFYNIGG